MATQYEREIEELLKKLGDIGPKETGWQRFRRVSVYRWYRFWYGVKNLPHTVPADQLMITAILLIVAAYFLRFAFRPLATLVGVLGVMLFCAAFIFSFHHIFKGSGQEIRWRGQIIDTRHGQPGLIDRLLIWFRSRFRGF